MKKIASSISVVVPVYNSQSTLRELCERLTYVLARFDEFEIILVDDSSTDSSFEAIKEIAKENPYIKGILLSANSGQQCAILCGLRHAKYDYTVIIDDDLEQQPEDIYKLYNEIKKGYDAVYAIIPNKSLRGLGSLMRDMLFYLLTDIPKGVKVSSCRIISKEIRNEVVKADTKFVYISMEILKHTNNIANIKTNSGPKAQSNYSLKKLFMLYKNIFLTYSRCRLFKKSKQKGNCYNIAQIVGGGNV